MFVLGVEGPEKKCAPPDDNFWNSPFLIRIIRWAGLGSFQTGPWTLLLQTRLASFTLKRDYSHLVRNDLARRIDCALPFVLSFQFQSTGTIMAPGCLTPLFPSAQPYRPPHWATNMVWTSEMPGRNSSTTRLHKVPVFWPLTVHETCNCNRVLLGDISSWPRTIL